MYSSVYNRICGWFLLLLGATGLATGHVADYLELSIAESSLLLVLGLVGIVGARSRLRYAVLLSFTVGLLLLVWSALGAAQPNGWFGSTEPLDTVWRLVLGGWGVYTSTRDILCWRRRPDAS